MEFSFNLRKPNCRNRRKSHHFCTRNSTSLIDEMFSNCRVVCTWAGSSVSCRIECGAWKTINKCFFLLLSQSKNAAEYCLYYDPGNVFTLFLLSDRLHFYYILLQNKFCLTIQHANRRLYESSKEFRFTGSYILMLIVGIICIFCSLICNIF